VLRQLIFILTLQARVTVLLHDVLIVTYTICSVSVYVTDSICTL